MVENLTPPTPPTPDLGQGKLEHELEMVWRFGMGVDLGEADSEQDVEIGAGTEMMKLEKQVERSWGEKGHQLQRSPGLADAQWNS